MGDEKETHVTIKFWAVIIMIVGALSWLSMTAFAHRERIVVLEATAQYMQRSATEIRDFMSEIRADLKEHIRETRSNGNRKK